ncbi:transcription factor Adf-1 [Dendroctonus ponderosae]|uniref:MADF domain-containing protein n=1 Tax=Dendroctonus ponderosae TaxID=77166 RepID=A0AAR5PUF3_DENPD|nr:transcription factor Adf-1 [Dendroctonus ponderosae]KAH1007452.1 hypothetical protein HUJ04_004682 [Dendroctonus ponderosae]KAH1014951.1 hypothetical protein HUJ05_012747 [Dendroctonus ponderosae]
MGRALKRIVDQQMKFDSKLVGTVKKHRHLFDKSHKLFADPETWTKTWISIANELGVTESYCEKRWLCIVYRMYDEVIWMIRYERNSLWLLFPQMDFLEQFVLNELELLSDNPNQIDIELDDVD